jgi:hypothetical protein
VNARAVPSALAEPFLSGVNALVEQRPPCVPSVPAQATAPPPSETAGASPPAKAHGHGEKRHRHGKGKERD